MGTDVSALLVASAIGQSDAFAVPWARIVLSLLLCLALAAGAIALLRKRSGNSALPSFASFLTPSAGPAKRQLELIERLPLSAASQLCLVRWGDEHLLLHVSGTVAQLIARNGSQAGVSDA